MINPTTVSNQAGVRIAYSLLILNLILSIAVAVSAQAPGANRGLSSGDGNHTIQGRVYFPAGELVNGRTVKVHLDGVESGSLSTVTDQDGAFRFNNVRAGSYRVTVDGGKDYEAPAESVNIDPSGTSGPVSTVTFQLRMKVDASNPAFAGVPKNALEFYQKGMAAAQKNNPHAAVDFLGKAVSAYPNFTLALSELGEQYLKLQQADKAAETFEALVKLKPDDASAQLHLGIAIYNQSLALFAAKKADEGTARASLAESHLRTALKLNSPGPNAHYYLGMTLVRLRKYDDAQKELELTLSNGGENLPQAHRYLGGLYQSSHRNREAADELEKYLKLDPKATDAERIKGIIKDLRSKP